uniref:Uncharacterized protein n=1 Tax=viral metagenome TaxID=1070528 RepID=A0A6C0EIE1_9ZZZZ
MENKNIENEIKLENLTTETILTNLKILSNIKPTDKLTQNGDLLMIDPTDFTQCVKRWWNNNSRIHTMDAIERIIDQTFITIDKIYNSEIQNTVDINVDNNYYYKRVVPENYFKTDNSQQLQILSSELVNAVKGLQNLKLTYVEDISICSKIDIIIDKITIRTSKINKLLTIQTYPKNIPK